MATESPYRAINAVRRPTRPRSVGGFAVGALVALATIGITASICASATAAVRGCYDGRIAFDSLRNGARDIYVIDGPPRPTGKSPPPPWEQPEKPPAPTTTPTRLTTALDDAKPSWSPPEPQNECENPAAKPRPTMIAFQRTTADGGTNIYAIDAATPEPAGQAIQVTHDEGTDTAPAWAPNDLALGTSGISGLPYLLDIETGLPYQYPPIAFERSINGRHGKRHDIFIANFDGSDETDLTNSTGADYTNPSWAAGRDNESWLTFDSDQGGVREVWIMQVTRENNRFVGSTPREVTAGQPASSDPSWFVYAPNGNSFTTLKDALAFAGPNQEGGPSQINVAEATTSRSLGFEEPFADLNTVEFYSLTNDPCEDTAPEWSPKGEFIVYQKTCAQGQSDIYVLKPDANDASEDVNLTEHVGDNQDPDWEAEQNLGVEYFPIRPRGKRSRTRARSASFNGGGGAGTGGGAETGGNGGAGGGNGSTNGSTGITGKPIPVPPAQLKQVIVRDHGRRRVIVMLLEVNAPATVAGELKEGRRRVTSHRWRVNRGTVRLRLRVPLRARPGLYQIRVIVRTASGQTFSVARGVRLGS